jgi:N,N'-diacetyllegionaminate synthase
MFKIGKKNINNNEPAFVIAEIAQAHDGSLGYAHAFIDIARRSGADAVKFQMHYPEYESTVDEKFRVKLSSQYKNRFEYWKRMEFSKEQWLELKKHCDQLNIEFMVSVFSKYAVNLAKEIGLNNIKISSGEIFNDPLVDEICKRFENIIFSTGMLKAEKIYEKIKFFHKQKRNIAVLHCISKYPVTNAELSLDFINVLKKTDKNFLIGYSDHSGSIAPPIYALSQRINILEVHLALDKDQYGPDTGSSLVAEELKFICKLNKDFSEIHNPKKKRDEIIESISNKHLFMSSLCLTNDKKKGEVIKEKDLVLKKPGTGIPYSKKKSIIGRKLTKNVSKKKLLRYDDFS